MIPKIEQIAWKRGIYLVAELGQNHQGELSTGKEMVDALVNTGVAAVKTAKRDIGSMHKSAKTTPYHGRHSFGATYYEHRKALELSHGDFAELKKYAEQQGFDFISSFTDIPSLRFLVDLGLETLKIPSAQMTDHRLLRETAKYQKTVILSSGMCDYEDIGKALGILNEEWLHPRPYLLQCTSSYPCEIKDVHLSVMRAFRQRFKGQIRGIGLSGHYLGIVPDVLAYQMGATIIERHFTLDRKQRGTDHRMSLEREDMTRLMDTIAQAREAMGTPEKRVLACEKPAIKKLRSDAA